MHEIEVSAMNTRHSPLQSSTTNQDAQAAAVKCALKCARPTKTQIFKGKQIPGSMAKLRREELLRRFRSRECGAARQGGRARVANTSSGRAESVPVPCLIYNQIVLATCQRRSLLP
jgi:hypothetical protein